MTHITRQSSNFNLNRNFAPRLPADADTTAQEQAADSAQHGPDPQPSTNLCPNRIANACARSPTNEEHSNDLDPLPSPVAVDAEVSNEDESSGTQPQNLQIAQIGEQANQNQNAQGQSQNLPNQAANTPDEDGGVEEQHRNRQLPIQETHNPVAGPPSLASTGPSQASNPPTPSQQDIPVNSNVVSQAEAERCRTTMKK
ncbi:MAG: hypothetical protein Q9227_001736 [Pyrenula ochraceoflavens]